MADDAMLLRTGLARLLTESGITVVAECADADDLLREVALHGPDVAVVDIRMPPTHTDEGLVAARRIRDQHRGTAVLLLSQYLEPRYAQRLLADQPGGSGTCSRSGSPTSPSSSTPCAGSPKASASSTPRSSPACCADATRTPRCNG